MIYPLNYHEVLKEAALCGVARPVSVIDVRSGRLYKNCALDIDPTSNNAFAYTEDGAMWGYEYGITWWAYRP